ncbi:MAG: YggS family pyridoxal phosphate-dependent enzyme [Woeseiaceae bacterium]
MIRVTENLKAVRETVRNAAKVAGRAPAEVGLLAVSKRHPVAAIQQAIDAGQCDFGENYVDEGVAKIRELARKSLVWHYIGALQSNKTRAVATHFDWVHTIDRPKIAQRLNDQRPADLGPLQVCIQVNIDNEPQKAGVSPEAAHPLAEIIERLPRLQLRGLMCLPATREHETDQRVPFRELCALQTAMSANYPSMDTLSMGMSGDLSAAIAEGSTLLRVGTAIFGPRP